MTEARTPIPLPVQPLELSYASLGGSAIPSATRENIQQLQHAADYGAHTRNLRWAGIGDIIWGLLSCLIGYGLFRYNGIYLGVFILGIVLLGVGTWIIASPSPLGMLVDGIMLLAIAAFNLLGIIMALSAGSSVLRSPIVAICQIVWGVRRLQSFVRFKNAADTAPSPETVRWLGELVTATLKAKPVKELDVIEFADRGALGSSRSKGKAKLLPELGIFVKNGRNTGGRRDVWLASQESVEIMSEKKLLVGKKLKVSLRINDKTMKVRMPEISLTRLKAWIASGPVIGQ